MSDNYLKTKTNRQSSVGYGQSVFQFLSPATANRLLQTANSFPLPPFPMVNDSIMTESGPEMLQPRQKIRPGSSYRPGNHDIILHLIP